MENIDELKEIFLSDKMDSEDYEENLKQIREWESEYLKNRNLLAWQQHDITKGIISKARKSYADISFRLAKNRELTEAERVSLWGKQDAMLWLISLASEDPKSVMGQIDADIKKALLMN